MKTYLQNISAADILQITSLLLATATFVIAQAIQKRRDREIANREIYQKLEFASIDLFRFEAANLNLIRPVWEKNTNMPPIGTAEHIATMNYVCQILNLFELAIKFRKEKVLPADIFGTWVAWFYNLITAPGFPIIWKEVNMDYLKELTNIINGGLVIMKEEKSEEKKSEKFYEFVSYVLKCKIIGNWMKESPNNLYFDFKESRKLSSSPTSTETPSTNVLVRWALPEDNIPELVSFFIQNAGNTYISHGEIQSGRSLNETEWSTNIEEILLEEFNSSILDNTSRLNDLAVAFYNSTLVGVLLIDYVDSANGRYATLSDIVIHQNFRHEKIGETLARWVMLKLKEENIEHVFAESNINNASAHYFLNKLGFKTISKVFIHTLK